MRRSSTQHLADLRWRSFDAAYHFTAAQQAYLEAADPERRVPEAELGRLAEEVLTAAGPYGVALSNLLDGLRAAGPSRERDRQIARTEEQLADLDRMKSAFAEKVMEHTRKGRDAPAPVPRPSDPGGEVPKRVAREEGGGRSIDPRLIELRQSALQASGRFLDAQLAYIDAADFKHRQPEAELKRLAEAVRAASEPYEATLRAQLDHLRAAEPSAARDAEIGRTEDSLATLHKERGVFEELIAHHAKMMAQGHGANSQTF